MRKQILSHKTWNINGLASKRKVPIPQIRKAAANYYFDREAAMRAVRFFETQCYHFEGDLAGTPLKLERWERRIVWRTFGWKWRTGPQAGYRVVRELYIEVPRKNGKSFLCSCFALYLFFADKEMGAQVVSAAAETEQAAIVYDTAKQMVLQNPTLLRLVGTPYMRSMRVARTASTYKVLSAAPNTKHGKNIHGGIVDEVHAHKNRDLIDVLATSTSARNQSLMVYITTAGTDRDSICWEKHEYARSIIDGEFEDHSFYGVIFAADEDDDWTDPEVWLKANPNLGVSKKLDYMERECRKAQRSVEYENTFRRLELNQWTEQDIRWIPMRDWDDAPDPVAPQDLEREDCFIGLDLSSTTDLTALSVIFPKDIGETEWVEDEEGELYERSVVHMTVIPYFWFPEDNIKLKSRHDQKLFQKWIREGYMFASPGSVVDYDRVRKFIGRLAAIYNVREIALDPWNSTQLATQLEGDGFVVVPIRQGFASLSAPSKTLLELVLQRRIAHGAHPVLRWCAKNVAIESDAAGNIKPSKKKSTQKIDGIVATVTGLARVIAFKDDGFPYNKRGIITT